MSQKLLTGNVLVLFCCVGLAVVPEVKSLVCNDSDAYNHLYDFLNHDTCESVDLVFKYLHDMTEQKSNGDCRRDIINRLANHVGNHAHTPDHCQCSGTFQLQHYSTSSTDGIAEDLSQTCLRNHSGYKELYYQFFHSNHEPQHLHCRTHHSLWTQLRQIDDPRCQKDIVYHISYAFSKYGDPCRCTEKTATTTSLPHQQGLGNHDNCNQYSSYKELDSLVHQTKCMSANTVWHLLDDLEVKHPSCRKDIQNRLTQKYNNVSTDQNDVCMCRPKHTLLNKDRVHLNNGSHHAECHSEHRSTYPVIENDLFTHITDHGCRNHNYLWPTLAGVKDHNCGSHCLIDCTRVLIIRASVGYPTQESDSCVCEQKPISTTHSPDPHGQGHQDHCYKYDSYRELASLANNSKCLSANSVWHLLNDLQKHDSGCRTQLQTILLNSYSNDSTDGNDECVCTANHMLIDKPLHHGTLVLGLKDTDYRYIGCSHEPGSTYHVIDRDLFAHITDIGCRNHNYLWPALAGVKNYTYHQANRDCTLDLITRAAAYYPSQDSDNCFCVHKTITSYTLAPKATTSTAQQASTPTTTTTTTATTKTTTTSTTQQPSTLTTTTTTTPATTTKSDVMTTPHGSIVVTQTTVSSHIENGWESWSPWRCKITKSDLHATCHSYRQRQCLSNKTNDCEGSSSESKDCQESPCSEADITYVNCSSYNQYSTCEDQPSCTNYSNTPWQICVDAANVAKCPRLCGCCPITTTTTTSTTTSTTTTAPTTTTTQTTSQGTTTIQQPLTPVPLRQCNHTCTLDAVILSTAVKHSKSDNCSSALNEALPQDCCTMGNQSSWNKGAQVQAIHVCKDDTPPPYTPIAAYNEAGLVPNTAGIFYGCNKDGQSGFMMVHQTCDQLPHLLHVDGTPGTPDKDPNNYFTIY